MHSCIISRLYNNCCEYVPYYICVQNVQVSTSVKDLRLKQQHLKRGRSKNTCTMCVGDNFRFAKPSAIKNVSAHTVGPNYTSQFTV